LFEQEDELIVEDIFDALFDFRIFHDCIHLALHWDIGCDFDGLVDLQCEFLELCDFLFRREFVPSEQCAAFDVVD
jgi:hypothetical protein